MIHFKVRKIPFLISLVSSFFASSALAETVVNDNQIVKGSTCIGVTCEDNEEFGYNTLSLKSETPQIMFNDTSSSSSFPSTDWRIGIQGLSSDDAGYFFIENITSEDLVLQISSEGSVALGAGAEVVNGAVSVGSLGYERRITFVADALENTDAVTLGQFITYKNTLNIEEETAEIDNKIIELETRINAIAARIEVLTNESE